MTVTVPKLLSGQFINDFDPYEGRNTIPAPLAMELDPETGWQEFQDTCADYDAVQANTAESPSAARLPANPQQNR